ncbi:MAG: delta-60 repeat domain-containing protein [Flavobacteriales bacterium]|nr:delta-60 repeat domain-containing protein [Flavobacteriales bacterium]
MGQSGSLDSAFDPGTGASSSVLATIIQPDGKILIGGGFSMFNDQPRSYLVRLNPDGSIDNSFVQQGTGFNGGIFDIELEASGTIIVAGDFTAYNGISRSRVARLNSDGSLNGSFIPGTINQQVLSLALQPDGRVLIGGSFLIVGGSLISRIARLNADGTLDATFNTGTGFNGVVRSITVRPNGRILVGGGFTTYAGVTQNRITQLMPDGSLDSGFDLGTGADNTVGGILVQSDNKVVVVGYFTSINGVSINGVCRLLEDGSLDTGFNIGGSGFTSPTQTTVDLAQQADGKILMGGPFQTFNGVSRPYLVRLESDGSLDLSFGSTGNFDNSVLSISIQSDEKVICGGLFTTFNSISRSRIARLNSDCISSTWYADADSDGYGDPNAPTVACTQPVGTVTNADDCDDTNPGIGVAPTWYADNDMDGYGDPNTTILGCIQPPNGVSNSNDCDDTDPGITELMWFQDEDGDGFAGIFNSIFSCTQPTGYYAVPADCDDQNPLINPNTIWYVDADSDGFGDPLNTVTGCTTPPGATANNSDCDDTNPAITELSWYPDLDIDGFGDMFGFPVVSCTQPPGYSPTNDDCDDFNPQLNPNTVWYADLDGDLHGDPNSPVMACMQPPNTSVDNLDCDDTDPLVYEILWYMDLDGDGYGDQFNFIIQCDQIPGYVANDQDCNDFDPAANPETVWFSDLDGDGFGDPNNTVTGCFQPPNSTTNNTDCDDTNPAITEIVWYEDLDGDGYGSQFGFTITSCTLPIGYVSTNDDCNDFDPNVNPATIWYADLDGDGYGDASNTVTGCFQPPNATANNTDCDDSDPQITEIVWYEDIDGDGYGAQFGLTTISCTQPIGYAATQDDCNDFDPLLNPETIWFADLDGDGYGDAASTITGCSQPPNSSTNSIDCDDTDPFINATQWYADNDGDGYGSFPLPEMGCPQPPNSSAESTDCVDNDPAIYLGAPCDDLDPSTSNDIIDGTCTCAGTPSSTLLVSPIMWLQGADRGTTLMSGDLVTANYVPLQEPYSALGYTFVGGGGESVSLGALDPNPGTPDDMAVDWVVVELRDIAGSTVIESRAGILRRNGAVHKPNSLDPLEFTSPPGSYRIAIRHRNHLPAVSAMPFLLNTSTTLVDMTNGSVPLYGIEPVKIVGGKEMLWAGDVSSDGHVVYTGPGGDRDIILLMIGGVIPTNTVLGYHGEDVNLDGVVKYTLMKNDRDIILDNIGGIVPTNQRHQQIP